MLLFGNIFEKQFVFDSIISQSVMMFIICLVDEP